MSDLADVLVGSPEAPTPSSSWRWGVVTGTAPLRVRLEPDDAALDITPAALVAVTDGDRVWCQLYGAGARKQLIVHGKVVA